MRNEKLLGSERQRFSSSLRVGLLAGIVLVIPVLVSRHHLVVSSNVAIWILFALGVSAIFSLGGQFSLAQGVFAMIGGYTMAILATHASLPLWLGALVGVGVSAAVAALIGPILSRTHGFYFAIATVFLHLMLAATVGNMFTGLTGGHFGISLGDISTGPMSDLVQRHYITWIVALGCLLFLLNTDASAIGRGARAVKSSEAVAMTLGLDPTRIKTVMLGLSAALAGLGGVLLVSSVRYIDAETFSLRFSLLVFIAVVIGGRSSVWGAVIGATGMSLLEHMLHAAPQTTLLIAGGAYIAVLLIIPHGLVAISEAIGTFRRKEAPAGGPRSRLDERDEEVEAIAATGGFMLASKNDRVTQSPQAQVLAIENLTISFGGLRAVDDVSLSVSTGTITALIGPNGAGKTSIVNAISGFISPDAGRILLEGKEISALTVAERSRVGLARTLQNPYVFGELRVWENIALGLDGEPGLISTGLGWRKVRMLNSETRDASVKLSRDLGLGHVAYRLAGSLSWGQRRLVEIGRATIAQPRLLLLDEPFAGLAPEMIVVVSEHIQQLRSNGLAILLVDHNLEALGAVADMAVFMAAGKTVKTGTMREVAESREVMKLYVGLD